MTLQATFTDLVRLQIELWNAVDAELRVATGLPLGTYETLAVLTERGPCRVQDIADTLVVTVGGVSKIVDRVEERGLCRRRSNPDDRRSSLVELTPEGAEAHTAASKIVDGVLTARLGAALAPAELARFAETLRTLRALPAPSTQSVPTSQSAPGMQPAPNSPPAPGTPLASTTESAPRYVPEPPYPAQPHSARKAHR